MYDDISSVSYKNMRAQVNDGDEYKRPQGPSGLKQYPIGARSKSARFFVEGAGGVFHVYYCDRMKFKGIKADVANEICRIHPDDTLEFTNFRWMHQQQYIASIMYASVCMSSRHGGAVLRNGRDVVHPIFRGLRVSMDAPWTALTPYTVHYRKLKKAEATAEYVKYADFTRVAPLLIEAMSEGGLMEMWCEHHDAAHIFVIDPNLNYRTFERKVENNMPAVLEAIERHEYVDAVMLFALHSGVILGPYRTPHSGIPTRIPSNTKEAFLFRTESLMHKFMDAMIREKAHCFAYTPRKEGESLRASKWGYEIRTAQNDLFAGNVVVRK